MSNDQRDPCGNEDCDRCYPLPRFKISTERVQRLFYERTIKAATPEEALEIYNAGTAWPSSYDDRHGEVLEKHEPVIAVEEPRGDWYTESSCWHNLPKDEFMSKASDEFMEESWTPEHEVERWRALVADLARTKALYGYDHKRTWSAIDALVDALDGFDGELLARVLKDVKETP